MATYTTQETVVGGCTVPKHRRSVRIETEARADLAGPHEVLLDYRIVNINLDGMAIESPALEQVGERVFVTLQFEEPDACIETVGQVIWTRESPTRQMGIRFDNLTDADRGVLSEHLYPDARDE